MAKIGFAQLTHFQFRINYLLRTLYRESKLVSSLAFGVFSLISLQLNLILQESQLLKRCTILLHNELCRTHLSKFYAPAFCYLLESIYLRVLSSPSSSFAYQFKSLG